MTPVGRSLSRNVLLAIFAHPGDAEVLCGGTLLRMAELGWKVHIAAMTRGELASATLKAEAVAAARASEARKSAQAIGAEYHAFDEPDGFVAFDQPTLRRTVDFLRTLAPSMVITHARKDGCVDHEQVSSLVRAACATFPAANGSAVPMVAPAGIPHLYFADPMLGREPGGRVVSPSTVIRITRQHARKLELVEIHATMLAWAGLHEGLPDLAAKLREHGIDRGRLAGAVAAEAFVQHVSHGFPVDDLLRELLLR